MNEIKHIDEQTPRGTDLNIEALYQLCPQCFTETKDKDGNIRPAVNFDKLREFLGDNTIRNKDEHYEFTWVGKRDAFREASEPITKTLRPCVEDSEDWENTKNLYIEGDNLDALKLLQKGYAGKINMIYIDPPYNTGKDFIYNDNRRRSKREENLASGDIDEMGNCYRENKKSNGEFHSDWCSMMYSRLMVARTLLTENGAIFISIDDNEVKNLISICNEIFGESNYQSTFHIQVRYADKSLNEEKPFKPLMEYVLVYSKNSSEFNPKRETIDYGTEKFCYKITELSGGEHFNAKGQDVIVFKPNEWKLEKTEGSLEGLKETWITGSIYSTMSYGKVFQKVVEPRVEIDGLGCLYKVLGRGDDGLGYRYYTGPAKKTSKKGKMYSGMPLDKVAEFKAGNAPKRELPISTFYDYAADFGNIRTEGGVAFNGGKKPIVMLMQFMDMINSKDGIFMDFFSGSASTAHAIMQKNLIDGGSRKFIMIQIPEECSKDSDAYKAGFENICELGKKRIRLSGKEIKSSNSNNAQVMDTGFRVLKLDDSNMNDVYFHPNEVKQDQLDAFASNIKYDRTPLDLLFDCMLRWGITLDMPLSTEKVGDCDLQLVNGGDLIGVFNGEVTEDVVHAVAKKNPLRVVFRDDCFANSNVKLNVYETFKQECGWSDEEAKNNIRVI